MFNMSGNTVPESALSALSLDVPEAGAVGHVAVGVAAVSVGPVSTQCIQTG